MLKFENQQDGEAQIRLFWKCAMRLKEVTKELPLANSLPMTVTAASGGHGQSTLFEKLEHAESVELSIKFPMLAEREFEVLALRFRPFFANGEKVHFLSVLSTLTRCNPALREWAAHYREQWGRAVFWGAMGLRGGELTVETDRVIAAGLYSKYFHVDPDRIKAAAELRSAIGAEMFDVALVSAVWKRAVLVVDAAEDMTPSLVEAGVIESYETVAVPKSWPNEVTLKIKGGPGSLSLGPPGIPSRPNRKT